MLSFYLSLIDSNADKILFEEIYEKNRDLLYNYAYRILHDSRLAEDAVQETFFVLIKSLHKIRDENCNKIRGYLIVIIRNVSFRIYNQSKKLTPMEDDALDSIAEDRYSLEKDIEIRDMKERVMDLIKKMNPNYGDVIMLKFYHGYSDEEIANALGITVDNVRVRLHRGREKLKAMMEGMLDHDGSGT
ncbi:MAG: RNA polymerase sigma factor [Ruminococcus sp.]|nr:RNA polymerase sigma factor [Ruminococcus sp.]